MTNNPEETFDYVVVGGGLAGCVVASRLSEDPRVRVLLLEAGRDNDYEESYFATGVHSLWKTEADWAFETTRQVQLGGRRIPHPRGRVIGGSAAINVGSWSRGIAADYDRWAAVGARGWDWAAARKSFVKIETSERPEEGWRGKCGPMILADTPAVSDMTETFRQACLETGIGETPDHNGLKFEGFDHWETIFPRGRRRNSAEAYLAPARIRRNLTIITSALVTHILFEGRRASEVVYQREGASRSAQATAEIVLCAGAFLSPRILMTSGVGPADHLRRMEIALVHDSRGVGENLIDHISTRFGWSAATPGGIGPVYPDLHDPDERERWRGSGEGALAANPNPCIAFTRSDESLKHADIELLFHINPPQALRPDERTGGFDILVAHVDPASRGHVRLASNDPLVLPIVDPAYLSAPGDLEALVGGVKKALALSRTQALSPYTELAQLPSEASEEIIVDWIREHPISMFHPVGTARMGADDDPDAVLDAELRVKGVEGLRVADASSMPGTVRGHTMAPVVYIAERASELIRSGRRAGS